MMSIGMPPRMLGQWAKEEIISSIDEMIRASDSDWDFDERNAIITQRNRVAKFLDQPSMKLAEILNTGCVNSSTSL